MEILKQCEKIYFIGIGGIGMSALARYFNDKNKMVFGYDKVKTPLTEKLVSEGMQIHFEDDPTLIPEDIDLVVLTPAIPNDHRELNWFRDQGYLVKKRSEVLGWITQDMKTIAVAGTHGKTSTSALASHILKYAGLEATALLGGILVNYNSNYLFGKSEWVVVEADEYDRSFLRLSPNVLIIMSMDADHLDIYGDHESMVEAYCQLTNKIEDDGVLIIRDDLLDKIGKETFANLEKRGVQLKVFGAKADCRYKDIRIENHKYLFDYKSKHHEIEGLISTMPGRHNIENATAAITMAKTLGVADKDIKEALESFKGIKRRFELVHNKGVVLVDDYAHHPEELKNAIDTILKLYEGKKIVVIFQPHLYSRTQDFYKGFARELSRLENVLLMPIYPAREEPIPGVESKIIFDLMTTRNKFLVNENTLVERSREINGEVYVTLGAADLDKYHKSIIDAVKNR